MSVATTSIELALDARAQIAEGPCWNASDQTLYWVDIFGGTVNAFAPATGAERCWRLDGLSGCAVPRRAGGLVVAYQHGFAAVDLRNGALERWHNPEAHRPANRFNDGKCDAQGRLWAGTKSAAPAESPDGGLYRLDADRTSTRVLSAVAVSNGLAWNGDGSRFYYIDTPLLTVRSFRCDMASGTLHDPQTVAELPKSDYGWADGMCIDAEGMVWIAHFGPGLVTRWDPHTRRRIGSLRLPVDNVTSCAFGGAKLDELYITTARAGLDEAGLSRQTHAGGIFVVEVGPIGLPSTPFAG